MSFQDTLRQWDEEFLQPIIGSAGETLSNIGVHVVFTPVMGIAFAVPKRLIKGAGEVVQAYQDARTKIQENRRNINSLQKMNENILKGIEDINMKIVALIINYEEVITPDTIKELYRRIQILNALGIANRVCLDQLDRLDKGFRQLAAQHSIDPRRLLQ